MNKQSAMQPSEIRHRQFERGLLAVALALLAVIGGAGWFYLEHRLAQERKSVQEELAANVDFKADLIERWIRERRSDAEAALYKMQAALFLAEPTNATAREGFRQWMVTVERVHDYSVVALFDSRGVLRMEAPENLSLQGTNIAAQIQTGLRARETVFVDLQQGRSGQPVHLGFLVPIFIRAQPGPLADGVLFLQIDPGQFLFPLVQSWPTSSRSAETLLVRREGNDVVFLNNLRFQTNAPTTMRRPIGSNSNLPSVLAAEGRVGLIEGADYRGVQVLAVARKIAGTPWIMFAKVDRDEIYAPLREQAWVSGLLVGTLMLVILMGFGIVWRQQKLKYSRWQLAERHRVEEALIESEERFRLIYEKSPVSYHSLDNEGHILDVNPAWLNLLGYERDEVLGRRVDEFFTPGDKPVFAEWFSRFRESGMTHGSEYEMRRKDGGVLTVALDGTFVRDEQGRPSHTHCVIHNVTERKRAEEALKQEHSLLRTLIDHIPDFIYVRDISNRFVTANGSFARLMGVTKPSDLFGTKDADYYPPETAAVFGKIDQEVFAGRQFLNEERVLRFPNGNELTFLSTKVPLKNDKGEVVGLIGIGRDITKRKKAEEALQRFQFATDQAADAIFWMDQNAGFYYVNDQACRSLGYTREELVLLNVFDIDPTYSRERWQEISERHEIKQPAVKLTESVHRRKDGSTFPVEIVSKYFSMGGVGLRVAFVRDITERKAAEKKLLESERIFRAIFNNTFQFIGLLKPDGCVLEINDTALEFAGLKLDEVRGKPFWDSPVWQSSPGVQSQLKEAVARAAGGQFVRFEMNISGRDERDLVFDFSLTPIKDESGRVMLLLPEGRDITEVKQARENLRLRESFLTAITENQPGLLWLKDADGRFLTVNKAFAAACGRGDPEQMLGLTDVDIWPKELAEKYINDDRSVISSGNPRMVEEMIVVGDGHVWHETFKTPVRNDEGLVIGTTGYARDITERKQAELALRVSETRLQSILESTGDGILAVDKTGRKVLKTNRQFAEMWRIPQSLVDTGDNYAMMDFVRGQLTVPDAFLKNESLYNSPASGMDTLEFKDGRIFESHAFPMMMDGVVIGRVWSFRDVTERKQADAALKQEHNLLRTLIDHIPDVIYVRDTSNRFVAANRSLARLMGAATPSDLIGKKDADYYPPESAADFDEVDQGVFAGRPVINRERLLRFPNGQELMVLNTKVPLKNEKGEVVGLIGIGHDITERKNAEEAMRRQNEYLTALQETMLDVASQLDLDRLLKNILKRAAQLMDTSTGFLDLLEPGDDHLTPKFALGALAEESVKHKNKPGEGLGGKVWQTGQAILVEDYDAWPGRIKSHEKSLIRSIVAAPFMSKSGFVGVLGLAQERKSNRTFGPEAVRQLDQFARFASIAIENARLYSTAQHELTQRKKAEEVLRQSREEFKNLFENAPIGYHELDSEGRIIRINTTELKMLGYSAEELLGQFVWKISLDEESSRQVVRAKLAGEMPASDGFERVFRRKDGSTVPVWIIDRLLKREDGVIVGIHGAIQDITERKQTEQALRESEKKHRVLIETTATGFVIVNAKGVVLDANDEYVRLAGFEKQDQILGRCVTEWTAAYDRDRNAAEVSKCIASGFVRGLEVDYMHPDGTVVPIEINASTMGMGNDLKILTLCRDITGRKQMELELRSSHALYHSFVDQLPGAAFRKDREGRFVMVNQRFCQIKGLKPEDFLGRKAREVPDSLEALQGERQLQSRYAAVGEEVHDEIMRTGKVVETEEEHTGQDGRKYHLHVVRMPVFDADGSVVGTQGIQFDITGRKLAEESLRELEALYHSLVEHIPAAVFRKDGGGHYVFGNAMYCRLKGVAPEEILGKTPKELDEYQAAREAANPSTVPPPQRTLVVQGTEHHETIMNTGERVELEEVYPQPDGSMEYFHAIKSPVYDAAGRIVGSQGILFDITARKRAEAALDKEQRLFNNLMTASIDSIYFKDRESRFIRVNDAFVRLLGFSDSSELLGKADSDIFGEHARQTYVDEQMIITTGEPIIDKEEREDWRDGRVKWVSSTKLPLRDGTGKIIGIMGISRDITERKRAEQELLESRALHRSLVEQMPAGIFRKDKEGRFVFVNSQFCQVRGFAQEDFLGRTPEEVIPAALSKSGVTPPEMVPMLEAGMKHHEQIMRTGKRVEIEEEWTGADGRKRYFSVVKSPVFDADGNIAGTQGVLFDITERKQAEESVRLLSRTVEQSPASIVITDKAGRIEYVNPKFCEVTGYTAEEVIGKNPSFLKSGETPPENYQEMWETISSGREWDGEFHNKKKSGELFWEAAAICPIFNAAGQIVRYLAVKEDITARKMAEEELRRVNRALQTTSDCNMALVHCTTESSLLNEICRIIVEDGGYDLAWVGFAENDAQKSIRCAARAGRDGGYIDKLNLTWADDERGHSPTGTVIRTGQMVICRDILTDPKIAPWRDEAIKHGFASFSVFPLLAEGKAFGSLTIYSAKSGAFHDEELKLLSELANDLGYGIQASRARVERQRAEERIQEQAQMLEMASDAIIVRDLERSIIYWNKGAEQLYGWKAEQVIGLDAGQILHADLFQFEKARETVLDKGEWRGEFVTRTKGGQEVLVEARWTLVKNDGGTPKNILSISTDITGRKKLEEQFYRAQRMESLGTLASGIAHDLNNVLQPIMATIELLRDKVMGDEGRELLDGQAVCVRRGAALIRQVLVFGRGIKGERLPVKPRQIVREIEQIIHETFPKSVELEVHCPEDLWPVNGDANQLNQVLLNLCVNARDAMPGGGKLSIRLQNVVLDKISSAMNPGASPGSFVVIQVADTGMGIPKSLQEKIFEPFFTTKSVGKGTGLGLSTSMAIIKSHGGFINCYSEEGKGSVFKVYLPVTSNAVESRMPGPEQFVMLPRGGNELVLLVDDEQHIRDVVRKILERFGYRVVTAANGAEAVSIYRTRQKEIAVVITDMAMPVMDGPAAIVELKSINPGVKIIGSSGMASEGTVASAAGAGLEHFLSKPYTAEAVLQKLQEVLKV